MLWWILVEWYQHHINCNVIAVLVCNFWLNKYLKVAIWKFTVNFHQFWMLSFEEIFQHQIFINYKLPSCSLRVEKYLLYGDIILITLWPVFSRVFTLGRMFFKSGFEGLGFRTILFIGTARWMGMNQPWATGGPELTSLVWLIGRWRSEESEGRSGNWTTSKYIFFSIKLQPKLHIFID